MKKSILTTTLLMAVICSYSQVGINTESPAATLDVKKLEEFDKTIPEGIMTPIFTGEELTEKNGAYTSAQMGTIVYVTAPFEASVPANDKTEDVKTPGYYFFNGTKWQALIIILGQHLETKEQMLLLTSLEPRTTMLWYLKPTMWSV